jgi:hypothetical protein
MNRTGLPRIDLPICSVPAPAATDPDLNLAGLFGSEGGAKKPRRRSHTSRKHLKKRSSRHKYTKKRMI